MKKLSAIFALCVFSLLPAVSDAYVGPGAGLSLLGALWALLAAIGTAIAFVIAWPIRRMRRRRREANERKQQDGETRNDAPAARKPAVDRKDDAEHLPSP